MRAPLDSSKDSSNNFVTGREPETTSGPLFSDDPSYQLFIHMLINFGIKELPDELIKDLDPGMQTAINAILEKNKEYHEAGKVYQSGSFLRKEATVEMILRAPSLFELTADCVKKNFNNIREAKVPPNVIDDMMKVDIFRLSTYSDSFKTKYTETAKSYFSLIINSIKKADYTLRGIDDLRLFDIASVFGTASILKAFVACGVDPTAIDTNQATALFYACRNERTDCLRYLLSQEGMNITAVNHKNQTWLHYAVEEDSIEHVNVFSEHLRSSGYSKEVISGFVNQRDNQGKTALQYAAEAGNIVMVGELMVLGSNPFLLDNQLNLAIDFWSAVRPTGEKFTAGRQALFARNQYIRSEEIFRFLPERLLSGRYPFGFVAVLFGLAVFCTPLVTLNLGIGPFYALLIGIGQMLLGLPLVSLCHYCPEGLGELKENYKQDKLTDLETESQNFSWTDADIAAESVSQEEAIADESAPQQEGDIENQLEGQADEGPSGWDDQDETEEDDEGSLLLPGNKL